MLFEYVAEESATDPGTKESDTEESDTEDTSNIRRLVDQRNHAIPVYTFSENRFRMFLNHVLMNTTDVNGRFVGSASHILDSEFRVRAISTDRTTLSEETHEEFITTTIRQLYGKYCQLHAPFLLARLNSVLDVLEWIHYNKIPTHKIPTYARYTVAFRPCTSSTMQPQTLTVK